MFLELLASPDQEQDLDPRALRVLLDREVLLENLVFRVSREMADPKESLVTLDLREAPDLRVRRARKDPLVNSVLLDLLEAVELEALLAAVVWEVVREEPAPLACPVPVVLLVMVDPVEPPEMLAAPVRLAQLVSEVSQEAPEAPDPQERKDLLVPLDKMAVLDLTALPDPEDSLETSVSPDPKDFLEMVESPEIRDLMAPLD